MLAGEYVVAVSGWIELRVVLMVLPPPGDEHEGEERYDDRPHGQPLPPRQARFLERHDVKLREMAYPRNVTATSTRTCETRESREISWSRIKDPTNPTSAPMIALDRSSLTR